MECLGYASAGGKNGTTMVPTTSTPIRPRPSSSLADCLLAAAPSSFAAAPRSRQPLSALVQGGASGVRGLAEQLLGGGGGGAERAK